MGMHKLSLIKAVKENKYEQAKFFLLQVRRYVVLNP